MGRHENRGIGVKIVELLREAPSTRAEIASELRMNETLVSAHLDYLRKKGRVVLTDRTGPRKDLSAGVSPRLWAVP
jgi:predicted ArsR family transcriptional regulator